MVFFLGFCTVCGVSVVKPTRALFHGVIFTCVLGKNFLISHEGQPRLLSATMITFCSILLLACST